MACLRGNTEDPTDGSQLKQLAGWSNRVTTRYLATICSNCVYNNDKRVNWLNMGHFPTDDNGIKSPDKL